MPDKILLCQNCHHPFVYSEYEQALDQKKFIVHSSRLLDNSKNQEPRTNNFAPITSTPDPLYDPICASIKSSEAKHPPKPKKSD